MRVQVFLETSLRVRFRSPEKAVIKAHLGIYGVPGADPVDGAFDFSAGRRAAGFAVEIGAAAQLNNVAAGVLYHFVALDDVAVFEAHLPVRAQAKIFWRRRFHEVVALDK